VVGLFERVLFPMEIWKMLRGMCLDGSGLFFVVFGVIYD